ncbi:hypothetical protein TL16_g08648 [Triparma laevis f. inornata]|uniref:Uncharacterized protein n=1 Tax=Triparma laevis f. inornata TaxID=1714386 RepID=A0A9W7B6V1_9STRA|nr:hypothetical protein TL16_g08648 [Triparma laevis f. inornata]
MATSGLAPYPILFEGTQTRELYSYSKCESVLSLIGTYIRGRHEILSDASNIMNVGHACYKLVFAILLASVGLSITNAYWNADSNFQTQPTFLKLSVSLKTASNWLVLPLLAITTLLLLYFLNWGWNLRFEGLDDIDIHTEETAKEMKKRRFWRGSLKLFGIFAYTIIFVVAFDFVYVFFVATNPTINPSSKLLANTALSQFKSTLLNERWAAKASMKLINPKKRFNYLVFTMSVVMLLIALVVPSILVLLLDERCFKYLLCGSAVIQAYSSVVILELLFGGFLQPALWWLCIDGGRSHVIKWTVLALGLFVSFAMHQIVDLFAEDLDGGNILPGGWALRPTSAGVFVIIFFVGWGATKLRREEGGDAVEGEESKWFYLPNVDYLLEFLDYNVDENRIGCIGILFRWLALSFLAGRYEKKTEGEDVKTDAQSIPSRCIVLVVICNVGFFGSAALRPDSTWEKKRKGGGL